MLERQNESFHIEWKKGRWRNRDSGIKGIKWNFRVTIVLNKGWSIITSIDRISDCWANKFASTDIREQSALNKW